MTLSASDNKLLGSLTRKGSLERLCQEILAGKVIFFVGSGFSLDSEGNSSWKLIGRLLARFAAMTHVLLGSTDSASRKRAGDLRDALRSTFSLSWPLRRSDPRHPNSIVALKENIRSLSKTYYDINDWMCSAFGELLEIASQEPERVKVCDQIRRLEEDVLKQISIEGGSQEINATLLKGKLGRFGGKAFFLDTMGFADESFMAGGPVLDDPQEVAVAYRGRLLDRHFVLARLAREGMCSTLLTTNYDLLLEGACRLIGFDFRRVSEPAKRLRTAIKKANITTSLQQVAIIAEPNDFFATGSGYRSALVVKIHGCVRRYREARVSAAKWREYLPAMVFTYREIQNWRRDSWSRDLVRTLLRTRTIVFCGYSGADPVLHDTFRSVYEEMSEQRARVKTGEKPSMAASAAPAYFLGTEDRKEFHGTEILRSASLANGTPATDVTDHPNYIQFYKAAKFPNCDELLLWLYHRIFRNIQRKALEADLGRIVKSLLGRPAGTEELAVLCVHFDQLERSELATVASLARKEAGRATLQRICAWTYRFQASLLRELALGHALFSDQDLTRDFYRLRDFPWYYPANERQDWTAWTTVVEIALRRRIAAQRNKKRWQKDDPFVSASSETYPGIFFPRSSSATVSDLLGIHVAGYVLPTLSKGRREGVRDAFYWALDPDAMPWPSAGGVVPSSETIWEWATSPIKDEWQQPFFERH